MRSSKVQQTRKEERIETDPCLLTLFCGSENSSTLRACFDDVTIGS